MAWGNLSENHHFYCFPSQNESQGSSGARNKTCTLRTPRSTYVASFHFSVYGLAKSLSYVVVTDTIFWKKRREILLHVFALGKQHGASVYCDTFHKAWLVNQKKKNPDLQKEFPLLLKIFVISNINLWKFLKFKFYKCTGIAHVCVIPTLLANHFQLIW